MGSHFGQLDERNMIQATFRLCLGKLAPSWLHRLLFVIHSGHAAMCHLGTGDEDNTLGIEEQSDARTLQCPRSRHLWLEKLKFCFFQLLCCGSLACRATLVPYPIHCAVLLCPQRLWGAKMSNITLIMCLQSFSQMLYKQRQNPKGEGIN